QLRAEDERTRVPRVIERLDAEMVAGEEELAPPAVPQREREHAGDAVEQPSAPLTPAVDQHFAVAVGHEAMTFGGELAPKLAKVVDLAIEDHGDVAIGGEERLAAAFEV